MSLIVNGQFGTDSGKILVLTGDPSISPGLSAPTGSLAMDLSGNLFIKFSTSDTSWKNFSFNLLSQRTVTSADTISSADSILFIDTSGTAFSLALPNPANLAGKRFYLIDTKGTLSTNTLTLTRFSTEKIEGLAASKIFQTDWAGWTVTTNGTDWFIF